MAAQIITSIREEESTYYQKNYTVMFHGEEIHTTVTHRRKAAKAWMAETERLHKLNHPYGIGGTIVGVDIEWRPAGEEHPKASKVATLQLCVGNRCLVYQLINAMEDDEEGLEHDLQNKLFAINDEYVFVGVGVAADINKLVLDYDGFGWADNYDVVDLQTAAAEVLGDRSLLATGLRRLCNVVLEKDMEKPRWITVGPWDNEVLSNEQVMYASVDAFVSHEIYRVLSKGIP